MRIFSGRKAIVPVAPTAIDAGVATRTGAEPRDVERHDVSRRSSHRAAKRLHWPMKSATNRVRGKP